MTGWRTCWIVFRKELLETVRDRRTLIVMLLLPMCLYPLIAVTMSQWIGAQRAEQKRRPSRVGVAGARWQRLDRAIRADARLKLVRLSGGARRAARAHRVDVALEAHPAPAQHLGAAAGETRQLELYYDETKAEARLAKARVTARLDALRRELVAERLERRGLSPSFARPLRCSARGVAGPRARRDHLLARVLPLLIVLMVLLGAFYPAIDLTAGEKERGTLETLLCAPVPRLALMYGKYLVVTTIAVVTGLLNLAAIGLTIALGFGPALHAAGLSLAVPPSALAVTVLTLLPISLLFSAIMLAVASLARTFKEAQNLLTPVYIVCMIPALTAQLPGIELDALTALLPVVNVALLTRDLIAGDASPLMIGVALGSTLLYAGGALAVAARIYNSERLLYAPERPARRRGGQRREHPEPVEAGVLLLAVMTLILLVGQPLQARSLIGGLLATEWVMIALPVVLWLRWTRTSARAVLSLRRPAALALVGAALCGLSGWYLVATVVEQLQQRVLPMPRDVVENMNRLLFASGRPLWLDLAAIAISPAICEELLFRGALLSASLRSVTPGRAILLNGLLFGLFHLSIYRFIPTALLGILLAALVFHTGSILPAMLFHALNNATALLVGRLHSGAETELDLLLVGGAVALFSAGSYLLLRHGGRRASEPGGAAP